MTKWRTDTPGEIAFIAGTYRPEHCGVAHYTHRLRLALEEAGVPSTVLTDTGGAADALRVTNGWRLRDLPRLVRAIHRRGPALVHIQHAAGTYGFRRSPFLLPVLLRASGWRRPIVTTIHEYGDWEWQPPALWRPLVDPLKRWGERQGWWEREDLALLTLSDAVIATHPENEQRLSTRIPRLAERVVHIPLASNVDCHPIAVEEARRDLRERCGWPPDARVVTFFGFLHPVKGLETLFHAFAETRRHECRARLLLIGGVESLALPLGQAERYLQSLHEGIDQLGLQGAVHLTGYVDDEIASGLLSGADVGVLPFNYGLNLKSGALLTLMAHGLPVVATRREPPVPEFEANALVRLFPPRDAKALSAALLDLLGNPDKQTSLRANAARFVATFQWPAIAASHRKLYRSLL